MGCFVGDAFCSGAMFGGGILSQIVGIGLRTPAISRCVHSRGLPFFYQGRINLIT